MDKPNILDSKKAKLGIIGMGAAIVVGAAAVAFGNVPAATALPFVLDAIKWIFGTYVTAQGAQDVMTASKAVANATVNTVAATQDQNTATAPKV